MCRITSAFSGSATASAEVNIRSSAHLQEDIMRAYLRISSLFFALLTIVHLLRLVWGWPLLIAGRPLPVFASLIAVAITGSMMVWAWRLLGSPDLK
jgi:hypothetical protein